MEHELERITAIAREGLRSVYEDPDAPEDQRLDTFIIVAVFNATDEDGDDTEGASVWCESRRHYVKAGILHQGLAEVDRLFDP